MSAGEAYSAVAAHYDELNAHVDYDAIADRTAELIRRYVSGVAAQNPLAVELGCGTGALTCRLAERGYDMIGLDISGEMLAVAAGKTVPQGTRPLFLMQDMRAFELYGTVGAAVCCFDGVGCLTGRGDVGRCFRLVANYLDSGGVFIFDINTPRRFETELDGREYTLSADGVFCAWRGELAKSGVCRFDYTVFTRESGGLWRRDEETQTERVMSRRSVENALRRAGLTPLTVLSGFTDKDAGEDDMRWTFVARK